MYRYDDQEGVCPGCGFLDPWGGVSLLGCGRVDHVVKVQCYFKNLLLYTRAKNVKTGYIVVMPRKGSGGVVNFMTPGVMFSYFILYSG